MIDEPLHQDPDAIVEAGENERVDVDAVERLCEQIARVEGIYNGWAAFREGDSLERQAANYIDPMLIKANRMIERGAPSEDMAQMADYLSKIIDLENLPFKLKVA